MFYQSHSHRIDTPSTYLDPQLVYTGNYWDEFGLTPFFIPDHSRVLMLGVGLGGGIRPLLSSTKNIQLDCVDLDANALELCQDLFKKNYPALNFNTYCADAENYIKEKKKSKYDFIWIDLYQQDSYCDLVFDPDFISHVRAAIKDSGVLAVNAYGVPTQFSPLACGSAQSAVYATLKSVFPWVGVLPNRRNQTLFASNSKPQIFEAIAHGALSTLDKKSFKIQSIRTQAMTELQKIVTCPTSDFSAKFSAQDELMRAGWKKFLIHLKDYQIELNAAGDLLGLIQNELQIISILNQALLKKDTFLLKAVAILCAGESFVHSLNVDWFFNWTLQNASELKNVLSQDYLQVWLTQAWALTLNPSKKYRNYTFQISALIDEAL